MKLEFQPRLENGVENDVTESLTYGNKGMYLWNLKSVIRLGMFMTKTDSAKLFRDAIINELQAGVTFKKAYQTVLDGYKKKKNMDYLPIFSI